MNEQEFAELAAGHALHALSPADQSRFAAALAVHPEWAGIAQADAVTASALADRTAAVEPPPSARAELLARVADLAQAGAAEDPRAVAGRDAGPETTGARRVWTRRLFALAASVAVLVGFGFGAGAIYQHLVRPVAVVALDEIQAAPDARSATVALDGGLTATAHWSADLGKAVLVSEGLPPLGDHQDFELWLVRGEDPIPAGVFAAEGASTTTALLEASFESGDVIAVTVEPAGGSPTGAPSSAPIVAIPTT